MNTSKGERVNDTDLNGESQPEKDVEFEHGLKDLVLGIHLLDATICTK